MTTTTAIVDAMVAGLANVTGFTSAKVSDRDWAIANQNLSAFVFPAGDGEQTAETMGGMYNLIRRIVVEVNVKANGDAGAVYDATQTVIDGVLGWFRSNDDLGGIVVGCSPVTWSTGASWQDANGVMGKTVTFTANVLEYV